MERQHEFAEKVAVVTDIANPYGRAIAMQLALNGCYVVAGDSSSQADSGIDELKQLGTLADSVEIDLSADSIIRPIAKAGEMYGRIDLLLNTSMASLTAKEQDSKKIFDVSFFALERAIEQSEDWMKSRPKIKIVNLLFVPQEAQNKAVFEAAGKAIVAYSKEINLPETYAINSVFVYSVENKQDTEGGLNELLRKSYLPNPDDCARAMFYLVSAEAKAVNRQTLVL